MPRPYPYAAADLLLGPVVKAALAALGCAFLQNAQAQGPTSMFGIHPIDIVQTFSLPGFQDAPGSPLAISLAATQVGSRAKVLGLTSSSATNAWRAVQSMYASRRPLAGGLAGTATTFSGTTASALNVLIANRAIAHIKLTGTVLTVDQPVEINRNAVTVDLGAVQLIAANPQPYMLRIEDAKGVSMTGGTFAAGDSAVLVSNSSDVSISEANMSGLTGAGIVVTGSANVELSGNQMQGLGLAGFIVHRGTTNSIVRNNAITGGTGFSNMMAGIVLTDREVDLTSNPRALLGPDGYWVISQPIAQRLEPPRNNLIAWNTVTGGLASAIYVDGAAGNVIFANNLRGNSKEGLCLDNGSTANVVASNTIYDNGERWGDPDWVLSKDSVLDGGRLPDGTAAEKVPGISLDNALYNVVFDNDVAHNFGGGVKIVRTGYFNAIGNNTIFDDNAGAGPVFHFFGIELGAAGGSSPDLDFTPSHGNIVFTNVIRGSHYSGVFFDAGSDNNNAQYNVILDATAWALESAQQMLNTTLNNLTTLPSRNIGSGLSSGLAAAGQPVNDPPM